MAGRRDRGDRPQVGTAQIRQRGSFPSAPSYQHSTRPYPYWWYSSYAPGLGFGAYDAWSWGSRPGSWWYSPYGYSPYGIYRPYGYGYGYGYDYGYGGSTSSRSDRDDDAFDDRPTGSIRLRVSPRTAKVYVDGALAGTVDDFDGLSDHLRLDPGLHQIELRAPGYQSLVTDVSVAEGKTITTRANMKKEK